MWINYIVTTLAAFVLILKGKRIDSSLLTLTICGLTLHSWLFIEIELNGIAFSGATLNKFTLVEVDKNVNPVKKTLFNKPKYFIIHVNLFH